MGAALQSAVRLRPRHPASAGVVGNGAALLLLLAAVLPCCQALAQDEKVVPTTPDKPYTLHVYEDLVQVPSLVLDVHQQQLTGLKAEDFTLRLDSGPPFHPRHTRLQGDDAVSFAFLIDDVPQGDTVLVDRLKEAAPKLPPDFFQPTDHVSVWAFDCHLVRASREAATAALSLSTGVNAVLHASSLHHASEGSSRCKRPVSLWDAIGAAILDLRTQPGRRVLVVISDGEDNAGHYTWEQVRLAASISSIAVFAIKPFFRPDLDDLLVGRRALQASREDRLGLLCGGSGGTNFIQGDNAVDEMLGRLMSLVRSRYILEFPRASNGTNGIHSLDVTVHRRGVLVHSTGISVPIMEKSLLNDPSTVPTDNTRAPVMGDRKIITPH